MRSGYPSSEKEAAMQTRLPMELVDRDMARVLAGKTELQRREIG